MNIDHYKDDFGEFKNYSYSAVSSTVQCDSNWSNSQYHYPSNQHADEHCKWSAVDSSTYSHAACYYYPSTSSGTVVKSEYDFGYDSRCHISESIADQDVLVQSTSCKYPSSSTELKAHFSPASLAPCQSSDTGTQPEFSASKCVQSNSYVSSKAKVKATKTDNSKEANTATPSTTTPTRKVTLRPHSTPATLMWLESNYELAEGVCIPRSVLYLHYVDFCNVNRVQPVNAASFGKIIRQQFPHLTTRRLGTRGQSRYHYYGIGIKETSAYYQLSYSKKSAQLQSGSDGRKFKNSFVNQKNQHSKLATYGHGKSANGTDSGNGGATSTYDPNSSNSQSSSASMADHINHNPFGEYQCHNKLYPATNHRGASAKDNTSRASTTAVVLDQQSRNSASIDGTVVNGQRGVFNSFVPVLPPFPTTEELQICHNEHNDLIPTFLLMYRAHCQRILDAIVRANFEEVRTLVYHFWQQIPPHLTTVLCSDVLINLLAICDIRLYRTIIKLISVTLAQPLSQIAYSQLDGFATSFDSVVSAALFKENYTLVHVKVELAKHFGGLIKCLLRHCRVYHSIQSQLVTCQAMVKQMYADWTRIDIDSLCSRLIDLYGTCADANQANNSHLSNGNRGKLLHKTVYSYLSDFKFLLANMSDCSQLFDWIESIWEASLQQYQNTYKDCAEEEISSSSSNSSSSINIRNVSTSSSVNMVSNFARHFLTIWTLVRLQIVHELIKHKATSQDLFVAFSALFDDFCSYKIEDLFLEECTHQLLANAAKQWKPTLPQYVEPLELIKHAASLVTNHGNVDGDNWTHPRTANFGTCSSIDVNPSLTTTTTSGYGSSNSSQYYLQDSAGHANCSYATFSDSVSSSTNGSEATSYVDSQSSHGQNRTQRQDSLICFSMNFHANSIQVMAAPPPPPPQPPQTLTTTQRTSVDIGMEKCAEVHIGEANGDDPQNGISGHRLQLNCSSSRQQSFEHGEGGGDGENSSTKPVNATFRCYLADNCQNGFCNL